MFNGKKKKAEELEIAESGFTLLQFGLAAMVFLEREPNRVKSFITSMYVKPDPTKEVINTTREDMQRWIAWTNQSIVQIEKKIEELK